MKITVSEYKQRILTLQKRLVAEGFDTLIVSEEEDIYYLTGLTYKSLERLFLLVIKKDQVSFLLPKMELAHLEKVANVDHVKYYWEYPAAAPERWEDILFEEVKESKRIGITAKTPFEISHFLGNQDLSLQLCNTLEEIRWIKSETEIKLIKQASKYCDLAISNLNNSAYYGMSELEVFAITKDIQTKVIRETEFNYSATNILVAAWPSRISHQPHGIPKVNDLLKDGSHISLAFLRVNGYSAELERTFFTAPPSAEQAEVFEAMLIARERSYSVLKAGVVAEEVDIASRSFLEKEGFGKNIMHRTGHGIGLGNHEGPFLAVGDKTILQENMIVSIEPGIYIEGVGGFRHSDTVRITKDGYEILTNCEADIKSLTFLKSKPIQKVKGKIIKKMFNI